MRICLMKHFPGFVIVKFKYLVSQIRALRVSYVGELGWELHHPMNQMQTLYEQLHQAGKAMV
ncbi:MAG: hypothetical protein Ct9H90mP9_6280 [Pseudomonadota bacterium]|nr:MAG: hypothetical protein Ct9H90mP9_6280 [Pseudomonadota bacterium]